MKNQALMLVGNGLNYFISDFIADPRNREENLSKIEFVRNLKKNHSISRNDVELHYDTLNIALKRYQTLLDDITLDSESISRGEVFLERLYNFTKTVNAEHIIENLEDAIKDRITDTLKDTNFHNEVGKPYSLLNVTFKTLFYSNRAYYSQNLETLFKKHGLRSLSVACTNYDFNAKSILCESTGASLVNTYIPLHGDQNNKIICTAPSNKEERIKTEPYFKKHYDSFLELLEVSNTIILFGLGLTSDPHILTALNHLHRRHFIIIDSNRESYINRNYVRSSSNTIGFDFLFQNEISFIDTSCPHFIDSKLVQPINTPQKILDALDYALSSEEAKDLSGVLSR